jgi:hypothetical protein
VNPFDTLPVTVPDSTDQDIEFYRLTFLDSSDSNVHLDATSTSSSFTIPGDFLFNNYSLDKPSPLQFRLSERYRRGVDNRVAQARTKWLRAWAGIRGLVNLEVTNTSSNDAGVFQLWLVGRDPGANSVTCEVTHPLDGSISCGMGSIDYATNTVSVPITVSQLGSTTMDITFNDSANGSAIIYDQTNGNWTGSARIVNPELISRSQINTTGSGTNLRTDVVFQNPIPGSITAQLYSDAGQDLGAGVNTPIYLWNNDYSLQYNSFIQAPLDGVLPQRALTYVMFNSNAAGLTGLLNADTFRVHTDTQTFRVDYGAPNPTSMLAPARSDITVNGLPATGFQSVMELTSQPITISWANTPSELPADTRWQIQIRQVLDAVSGGTGSEIIPHTDARTARLADGEGGLVYTPGTQGTAGTWTWTGTQNTLIPTSGVWRINLRATDADNTIRGNSQAFFVTDQVAN